MPFIKSQIISKDHLDIFDFTLRIWLTSADDIGLGPSAKSRAPNVIMWINIAAGLTGEGQAQYHNYFEVFIFIFNLIIFPFLWVSSPWIGVLLVEGNCLLLE